MPPWIIRFLKVVDTIIRIRNEEGKIHEKGTMYKTRTGGHVNPHCVTVGFGRTTIKLHLTGKACLIFEFYQIPVTSVPVNMRF